jgi:hypothetical protein
VLLEMVADWTPGQAYDFNYTPTIAHLDNLPTSIYDAALTSLSLDLTVNQSQRASKVDALVVPGKHWLQSCHALTMR